jgi:hypothetical protein
MARYASAGNSVSFAMRYAMMTETLREMPAALREGVVAVT